MFLTLMHLLFLCLVITTPATCTVQGCRYFESDVDNLKAIAERAIHPTKLLISHGPPRWKDLPALIEYMTKPTWVIQHLPPMKANAELFPFGLFGNVQEAGGRATDLSGHVIAERTCQPTLSQLGPADAMRLC